MLPNLFIVGTPKSGTTSLYNHLSGHPDVFMCPVKEPNFFAYDQIRKQNLYYTEKGVESQSEYEALFSDVTRQTCVGEASVAYLFYPETPKIIKTAVPDARVLIILRDPTDRCFSHYLMDKRLGYVTIPFEDIVYKRTNHPCLNLYYQQFIELGLYHEQVKRYLRTFGCSQVKIFLHEDLKRDMSKVFFATCEFLRIDTVSPPNIEKQHNVYRKPRNELIRHLYSTKAMRKIARAIIPDHFVDTIKNGLMIQDDKPQISKKTRQYLKDMFKDDIQKTAVLIGRDLSAWYS